MAVSLTESGLSLNDDNSILAPRATGISVRPPSKVYEFGTYSWSGTVLGTSIIIMGLVSTNPYSYSGCELTTLPANSLQRRAT